MFFKQAYFYMILQQINHNMYRFFFYLMKVFLSRLKHWKMLLKKIK